MFEHPPVKPTTNSTEKSNTYDLALMDYFIKHFNIIPGREYTVQSMFPDSINTDQPTATEHLFITTTTSEGQEKIYPLDLKKYPQLKAGDKVTFTSYPEKPNLESYFGK